MPKLIDRLLELIDKDNEEAILSFLNIVEKYNQLIADKLGISIDKFNNILNDKKQFRSRKGFPVFAAALFFVTILLGTALGQTPAIAGLYNAVLFRQDMAHGQLISSSAYTQQLHGQVIPLYYPQEYVLSSSDTLDGYVVMDYINREGDMLQYQYYPDGLAVHIDQEATEEQLRIMDKNTLIFTQGDRLTALVVEHDVITTAISGVIGRSEMIRMLESIELFE